MSFINHIEEKVDKINMRLMNRFVFVYNNIDISDTVLEIGSGEGLLSSMVYSKTKNLTCIDSKKGDNVVDGIIFIKKNFFNHAFKEKFDTIILAEVIEHMNLESQKNIISMCYDLLNDKGKLIITTPNKSRMGYDNTPACETHVNELTHKELVCLCKKKFSKIFVKVLEKRILVKKTNYNKSFRNGYVFIK